MNTYLGKMSIEVPGAVITAVERVSEFGVLRLRQDIDVFDHKVACFFKRLLV